MIAGSKKHYDVPNKIDNIQVNVCNNYKCECYGDEQSVEVSVSSNNGVKTLANFCVSCERQSATMSNEAISKTALEIYGYRHIRDIDIATKSCKTIDCGNNGMIYTKFPHLYKKNGKNSSGGQQLVCKECNKQFSIPRSNHQFIKSGKSYKNKTIFSSLINGLGIRRISYLNEISTKTVYDKLSFFYEQCLRFNHHFDEKISKKRFTSLRTSTDAINITTNWRSRKKKHPGNKSGVKLTMVVTCDNWSGFNFAQSLPFDSSVNSKRINSWALSSGELDIRVPHRRNPHYVYNSEGKEGGYYLDSIPTRNEKLIDTYGIKIVDNYLYYAHWFRVKKLTNKAKKVAIYYDTDNYSERYIPTVFNQTNINNNVETYAMSFDYHARSKSRVARNKLIKLNKNKWESLLQKNKTKWDLSIESDEPLIKKEIKVESEKDYKLEAELATKEIKKRFNLYEKNDKDKWVEHPNPQKREQRKSMKWDTERSNIKDKTHIFKDMEKASTNAVDNYFQKLRVLSFFQRSTQRADDTSGVPTIWEQNKSYDPKNLVMIAEIFKTYHNFIHIGKDFQTCAQRLGITKKAFSINEVLRNKY